MDSTDQNNSPMVIITRAGSRIGAQTTINFLRNNTTVLATGSNLTRLQQAVNRLPQKNNFIALASDQLVEHLEASESPLAAIIFNIGHTNQTHMESAFDRWTQLQRDLVSDLPLFHQIRHILRKHKARVIHVASIDDVQCELPTQVALVAIKTAVNMLTAEVAIIEPRITSLAVHPSFAALGRMLKQDRSEEEEEEASDLKPAGDLIVDLALTADRSMSGKYFMYSEPSTQIH
ncbi:hypothetical protein GGI25_004969 [Coemansia spiralis]|uniref:Uncharacterized protein n=2 Tax=Coemansia TaxID=4863 RepID=A0A9W8FZF6_9FUNG|nr:hypothetical protein BX070DRAFT_1783 [Coemansia spiralis]KAJ1989150.1 hypothetical protein EDC05_004873 [Coemansia umbellata]KAJ2620103.1 hypothetical protein GGI26_005275 [Coemansia sp. RSA 1358]KAJ2672774.1 hypothetical protein GGI25_004969 [Coemansia spiralis]